MTDPTTPDTYSEPFGEVISRAGREQRGDRVRSWIDYRTVIAPLIDPVLTRLLGGKVEEDSDFDDLLFGVFATGWTSALDRAAVIVGLDPEFLEDAVAVTEEGNAPLPLAPHVIGAIFAEARQGTPEGFGLTTFFQRFLALPEPTESRRVTELLEANNRYQQEGRDARAALQELVRRIHGKGPNNEGRYMLAVDEAERLLAAFGLSGGPKPYTPMPPAVIPDCPFPSGGVDTNSANAKRDGWYAFFTGRARGDCPFPPASPELWKAFVVGWDAAEASRP